MAATLDELYKFYNNGSTLHVCGAGVPPLPGMDAAADQTVRTQAGIHARFQQLGYRGKRCEVATVDSSHSIGGSVVVMVTGAIVGGGQGGHGDSERRAFTQTFVLAPQEGGYYVLNDIVRFVDAVVPAPPPAPRAAPPPQANVAAHEPPAAAAAASPAPPAPAAPPAPSAAAVILEQIGAAKKPEKPEPPAKTTAAPTVEVAKESEGPTTYASIAAKMRAAAAAKAPVAAKPSPAAAEHSGAAAEPKPPATASSATGASAGGEKMTHDPVTAVFVRNIPQSADEASIEAAFAKIGPIATVTIRTAKRQPDANDATGGAPGRYAFVQFEKAESAQAAIEATVEMDGRALSVEEKREGGHNNRNQSTSGARRNQSSGGNKPGSQANGSQGNNRREGTRGPRRDGEGGKHSHQGERRPGGGPRREGGDRRQPARQPAAAKA